MTGPGPLWKFFHRLKRRRLDIARGEQAQNVKPVGTPPVETPQGIHSCPAEEAEEDISAKALQKPVRALLVQDLVREKPLGSEESTYWTQISQLRHPVTNSDTAPTKHNSSVASDCSHTSNTSYSNADSAIAGIFDRESSSRRTFLEMQKEISEGLLAGMNNTSEFFADLGRPTAELSLEFEDLHLEAANHSRSVYRRVARRQESPKACNSNKANTKIPGHGAFSTAYTLAAESMLAALSEEKVDAEMKHTKGKVTVPAWATRIATSKASQHQRYDHRNLPLMSLLSNMPVEIQDPLGKRHFRIAVLDTGSDTSFMNEITCKVHGISKRLIPPGDLQVFATAGGEFIPMSHVSVPLRISAIGLHEFNTVNLLAVSLSPKIDIILGRDFIDKHKILRLSSEIEPAYLSQQRGKDRGPPFLPATRSQLFVIEAKESTAPEFVGPNHGSSNELAMGSQHPRPPEDAASPTKLSVANSFTDLSDLKSEDSASISSSSRSYSDLDCRDSDAEDSEYGIHSHGSATQPLTETNNLKTLLAPMMQGIVKGLVKEYQEIYFQDCVDGTRQCSPQSESTTTSNNQITNLSTPEVVNSVAGKRAHGSSDEGNPDGDDGGPPKRHKGKPPGPSPAEVINHNFACPYRKYDVRKYCAMSRQWRFCATTSFENVSRLKAHLYKYHKIHQCTQCWQNFPSAEALKAHVDAIEECQRCLSKEAEGVQGVNADMERRLRSRKKTEDAWSQKDRWIKIFTMLFGNIHLPDPYFEQPIIEEIDPAVAVLSPDSRQLSHIEGFLHAELPPVIENVLQQMALPGMTAIENQLRVLLPGVIRDSQDQVFSHYRSRLTTGQESPLPHAQIATAIVQAMSSQSTASIQPPHEQAFASQSPSQGEQLTNLAPFFSQPPYQMPQPGPNYPTALPAEYSTSATFEQASLVDSGIQADATETGRSLIANEDAENVARVGGSKPIEWATSQDLQTDSPSLIPSALMPPQLPSSLPAINEETPNANVPLAETSPAYDQINEPMEDPETKALWDAFTYG